MSDSIGLRPTSKHVRAMDSLVELLESPELRELADLISLLVERQAAGYKLALVPDDQEQD